MAESFRIATLLPTAKHPKLIALAHIVLAVVVSSVQAKNAGDFFLVAVGLAVASVLSYHSQTYFLPVLVMALTWVIRERVQRAEHYQILNPQVTAVDPNCMDVKADEIMALFENDKAKLRDALDKVGVPFAMDLTDETAPLFATYLLSYVKKVNGKCKLPVQSHANANMVGVDDATKEEELKPY